MRVQLKSLCLSAGLSAVLMGAGAVAMAGGYTPPPQAPMMRGAQQSTSVSPQVLAKFKRAYRSVQVIEKEYSAKLQHAHNSNKTVTLRKWAQRKMVRAVKQAGLTVPQYDKVMMLVQREPALRKRVLGH